MKKSFFNGTQFTESGCEYTCEGKQTARGFRVYCRKVDAKCKPRSSIGEPGTHAKALIEQIVEAAHRPMDTIVEVIHFKGDDGNWYSPFGRPFGIKFTGEKRSVGFAFQNKEGATYGEREATREELIARYNQWQAKVDKTLRKDLTKMTDTDLQEAANYWLYEK